MDFGDIVAASQGVLLAGTWALTLRFKRHWHDWREKSALFGLVCASIAVLADLVLTMVMHFRGESSFAAVFFVVTVIVGALLGLASLILGILGKGTPRVATLAWSIVVLGTTAITLLLFVFEATT